MGRDGLRKQNKIRALLQNRMLHNNHFIFIILFFIIVGNQNHKNKIRPLAQPYIKKIYIYFEYDQYFY